MLSNEMGQWVKARREALDLTRAQVAGQIGCAVVTLEKIERGQRRPSKQMAELLAGALKIPAEARDDFIRFARVQIEPPALSESISHPQRNPPLTHLPAPLTSFVNRTRELADICAKLRRPDVRLLTLVGPPGIGKTHLSIQVGQTVLNQFADGVWFVALAPISDPVLVLPTIAGIFNIAEGSAGSLLERLQSLLHSHQMLLILDNFEHVPEAALHVANLLKACSKVKVLATSRVPLRVYGEQEYRMPALMLPPSNARLSLQQMGEFDAIKLFVTRVRDFQPDFELDANNVHTIADICTLLDGMPLAIELAATRLRRLTLDMLHLALQDEPMRLLMADVRDVEPRQLTLRNTFKWSYDLLSAAERIAFARLGVFVGGCTTEAALAVCELADDATLHDLVDQSMLKREGERGSRWVMLEMMRKFALEQLSGDMLEQAQQRHAEYFARNLRHDHAQLSSIVDVEQHNARAALHWLLNHKHALTGELALFMCGHFDRTGLQNEGRGVLAEVLSANVEMAPVTRNNLLAWASVFALHQNDFEEGLRYANEALADAQAMNSQALIADRLSVLAYFYIAMDDCVQAKYAALEALHIGRTIEHPESIVSALDALGQVAVELGDLNEAESCFEEAYRLCQASDWGHDYYTCLTYAGMGEIALIRHQYDHALQLLQAGLMRSRVVELRLSILNSLASVIGAMPQRKADDLLRAAKIWGAAEALNEKMGLVNAPGDCRRIDARIADARTRVHANAFINAWAAGRELSLDEAVALALE